MRQPRGASTNRRDTADFVTVKRTGVRLSSGLASTPAYAQNPGVPDDILTVASELADLTRLVAADDFKASTESFVNRIVRTIPGCDDALITVRSTSGVETVHTSGDLGFDPLTPGP